MAIKTNTLELDAYERLKRATRGKESFSAVVRRAHFDAPESRVFYQLRAMCASVQRFVNMIPQVLIRRTDILKNLRTLG